MKKAYTSGQMTRRGQRATSAANTGVSASVATNVAGQEQRQLGRADRGRRTARAPAAARNTPASTQKKYTNDSHRVHLAGADSPTGAAATLSGSPTAAATLAQGPLPAATAAARSICSSPAA